MEYGSWSKTILGFILAAALGFVAYWIHEQQQLKEMEALKIDLKSLQDGFNLTREQNKVLTRVRDIYQQIVKMDEEKLNLARELSDMVKDVRKRGVGLTAPELKLQDGATLTDVKIQKVSDMEMTVSHSTGVAHVSWKQLPEECVLRYRMSDPLLQWYQEISTPKTETSPPAPQPVVTRKADMGRVRELETQIARISTQIQALSSQQTSWRAKASDFRRMATDASARRHPNSHMVSAHQADDQVQVLQQQIIALNSKQSELQRQLSYAYDGVPAP